MPGLDYEAAIRALDGARAAAPGTTWAIERLAPAVADKLTTHDRLVLLVCAALADRDLHSPNGYGSHAAVDLFRYTSSTSHGLGLVKIEESLAALVSAGFLVPVGTAGRYRLPPEVFFRG